MTVTPFRARVLSAAALLTASSLLLAGCASGSAAGKQTITIFDWGGPTGTGYEANNIRALYTPCATALGVDFQVDEPMDYSKIRTAVSSGNVPWDVMNVQNDFGVSPEELSPIDFSIVTKDKFSGSYAQQYRVGSDTQATVFTYNTTTFGSGFTSVQDFFDTTTYPGKRAVPKSLFAGLLEMALLADGVPADHLYPLDLDRAFAKLDTIKGDLVFWDTGATSQSLIASGEVVAALVWLNRADDAINNDHAPFEVYFDQWIQTDDYWVVPKGAKNPELANRFIECITDPAKQADWSNAIVFGPTTTDALASPDLKENKRRPTSHMEGQVKVDDTWWSDNYKSIAERWNAWMTA